MSQSTQETIAVIGLGYVGLPVALSFAKKYPTIGFDISERRIKELREGLDVTAEVESEDLTSSKIKFSADPADLAEATFIIVAVPTPIDKNNRPDLTPVIGASRTVGKNLRKGAVVVYESTVYPGVTEEECGPVLEQESGLKAGEDFFLGYSPERINPGDKEHTFERIVKVVSGQDAATLDRVSEVYSSVVTAGVHRASTIKVAEAAKVIENTQRDLNIALMNELALIFDRVGIRTKDVLEAAGTKWNFLKFTPGLVGGHCIGVDPYYLTTKAEELGYQPEVILAGRRINNNIGAFVAQKALKLMAAGKVPLHLAKVGIFGLTFKENVPDLRNSKVPDIVHELRQFGVVPLVHDPMGDSEEAEHEYGIKLSPWEDMSDLNAAIFAVSHSFYLDQGIEALLARVRPGGAFVDVKSAFQPSDISDKYAYWSL
ncbi:nucleotide sugar dehydrogenase [Haliangium ochraceum]|uniref:Nucleotide sugar dehydrogenase n=1 Tax=Haliangium ochraceum (strain DSM 14365 / JCM 11303 / SMP-2) TaxID=502025 RepID=D0LWP7_HALO1|nr:nucleotide sugar dehydrogenase [Haliangium ochraceum]ACY17697.1 nucleotide sugar dehydrogenase [Haliangium ochraceum DSM 14365]